MDPELQIETQPKILSVFELNELYQEKVPVHRFAHKELTSLVSGKANLITGDYATLLPELQIDPELIAEIYFNPDGDTSFEELTCIGLDPNAPDTLVGVIHVKQPSGFSGGPCYNGSTEYVTFWADFDDNGTFETCLGTADVQVYDLRDIPPEGVHYAVRLPVDLEAERQPCKDGARLVRIRAILSWNSPALCAEPNRPPVWGNREETLIHIGPVPTEPAGKIAILGGIPVSMIDAVSGLTTSDAKFALNNLRADPDGSGQAMSLRPPRRRSRAVLAGPQLPGGAKALRWRGVDARRHRPDADRRVWRHQHPHRRRRHPPL